MFYCNKNNQFVFPMVQLFFHSTVILFVLSTAIFSNSLLFADETTPKPKEKVELLVKYKPNSISNFIYIDSTTEIRTFEDGSTKTYDYFLKYWITVNFAGKVEKGFSYVNWVIDSLDLTVNENNKQKVRYNTMDSFRELMAQKDGKNISGTTTTIKSEELNYAISCTNRDFQVLVSPYGEVAKFESEQFDELKRYIVEEGKDYMDPISKFYWLDGISDNQLRYVSDIHKGLIPGATINPDSMWSRPYFSRIGMIDVSSDSSKIALSLNNNPYFEIKAEIDTLRPMLPIQKPFFGIPYFVTVDSGLGSAQYSVSFLSSGIIRSAECLQKAKFYSTLKNEKFIHSFTSKQLWLLQKQRQR